MQKSLFALSFGFAALILATQQGFAQGAQCAPRAQVVQALAETYGESRRFIGLAGDRLVMETFASEDTGSWTILVTRPDGIACLVTSGEGYEPMSEALPTKGDPA